MCIFFHCSSVFNKRNQVLDQIKAAQGQSTKPHREQDAGKDQAALHCSMRHLMLAGDASHDQMIV